MKSPDHMITFSLLSLRIRIGNMIVALCLIAACAQASMDRQQIPVLALILIGVTVIAAGFLDRWQFDCKKRQLRYCIGFIIPLYIQQYMFDEIEETETEHFTKGFRKVPYMKCLLRFKSGHKKTIAVFPLPQNADLAQSWERLRQFL